MDEKSIIIIGAGIAGLSAGCYAQMNGYRTQIFEQDTEPGGLCTSWKRGDYTINGGLALLFGSGPGIGFYRIWEELGAVQKTRMIDYEYLVIVEGTSGETFYLYNNIDRLEQHMKELAPEDKDLIEDFIKGARVLTRYDLPIDKAPELISPIDKIKMLLTKLPLIKAMEKWKKISIQNFASRYKNAFLREAFYQIRLIYSPELPVLLIQLAIACGHLKAAGFPEGGALGFARTCEQRLIRLGGTIQYKSRVVKILVKNDRAVGIRLEDGSEHRADYVISAADGRATLFDMLEGKYINKEIRGYYDRMPVGLSLLTLALGVTRSFENLPHTAIGTIYPLEKPVNIGGKEVKWLRPMIYNFDQTLAPEGKTVMRLVIPSDYDYWKSLRENPERYKSEKQKIADTLITLLDQRYPGLASQVEICDVSTPITFERYTGNWKGSGVGWDCTTENIFMPMRKNLPGLKNFYMAGQWVEPGGCISTVAVSGRNVIQLVCKKDKKPFATAIP